MDRLVEVCLDEIALEGLDGITLETFWMRLQTRDPKFTLAIDDASKPVIWQWVAQSEEVEFFQIPEPRNMPVLRDLSAGANPLTGMTVLSHSEEMKMKEEVYPILYVCDAIKGVRGSCPMYYQRIDVTNEVRNKDGSIKMTVMDVDNRWGAKLVIVANQDLRWKNMVGAHGDPEVELRDKQYAMLEYICRGRHLGEWQWRIAKLLKQDIKNLYYLRKRLQAGNFIKKRTTTYQVEDRPHLRAVVLFGTSFKERLRMPMYDILWQAISDLLEKKPNRSWTQINLRAALRDQFSKLVITEKTFKRVIGAAHNGKMVLKSRLPYNQVYHEPELNKKPVSNDTMVVAIKLLKTYQEYLNEENLENEEEDEDKSDLHGVLGDPQANMLIAEHNIKAQVLELIEYNQTQQQTTPERGIRNSLMIDYYVSRYIMKRLVKDNIITKIMIDEGRQRTGGYCTTNSLEAMQQILRTKHMLKEMGTPSSTPAGSRSVSPVMDSSPSQLASTSNGLPAMNIKQEYGEVSVLPNIEELGVKGTSTLTYNFMRRRKFVLDFMRNVKVVERIFPIVKALRIEEKRAGSTIICDTKTVKRLIGKLCEQKLLQTISTGVMSDDGLHTKTVNLITEYGIKPVDSVVTSALQVAKFRFFGSCAGHRKRKKTGDGFTVEKIEIDDSYGEVTLIGKTKTVMPKDSKRQKKKHAEKDKHNEKNKHTEKNQKDRQTENNKQSEKSGQSENDRQSEKDGLSENDRQSDKEKKSHQKKSKKSKHKDKPETVPTEGSQRRLCNRAPFGSRKYYYRQLGYLPKMLRMQTAHLFVWYLAYGHSREALKTETIDEIEKMTGLAEKDDETGTRPAKNKSDSAITILEDIALGQVEMSGAKETQDSVEHVPTPVIPVSMRNASEKTIEDELVQQEAFTGNSTSDNQLASSAKSNTEDASLKATTSQENRTGVVQENMIQTDQNLPQSFKQSVCVPTETDDSQGTLVERDQSGAVAPIRTDQSDTTTAESGQSGATDVRTNQSKHKLDSRQSVESIPSGETTPEMSQSPSVEPSQSTEPDDDTNKDVVFLDSFTSDSQQSKNNQQGFTVYCDTMDWRRYVPPLPIDAKRQSGWCLVRDLLLSMPLSIFLKLISLPIEIDGVREYIDHPVKQHILMRHLPIWIRSQMLRGRRYLSKLDCVFIKLSSIGLIVMANSASLTEKDKVNVYVCKKTSILDTTTSKPHPRKISDQQRYLRRYYQLNEMKDVRDFWFDLQCICLDTPLGFSKKKKEPENLPCSRHDAHIRTIAWQVTDMSQPIKDSGYIPGDNRGAGGLDSSFFAHLRRNWNWYSAMPKLSANRYAASDKHGEKENQGEKPKVMRLGSIQYRRSNMSQGTTVEVVSVSRDERKEMQGTVGTLKRKRPADKATENSSPPSKTRKQVIKEKNKDDKELQKTAKKKDGEIKEGHERRKMRKPKTDQGKRNTKTYDDVDEDARSQMVKMRVCWSAEEDSLILLCRVALSILNVTAKTLGPFVPWFVIRDVLHKSIEMSKDKTTKSVAKRGHHILKNKLTFLNYKICLAEAQADKELMDELKCSDDEFTNIKACTIEYERVVAALKKKFQSSECSLGALRDLRELSNYIVTPVHQQVSVDETISAKRDIKSISDLYFKLLHSLVLSTLVSCQNTVHNRHLLYKVYAQYNENLLGDVVFNLKKIGLCNRNLKQVLPRIVPFVPASTQLSHNYKDRFLTRMPETVVAEMDRFLEKLHESGDSMTVSRKLEGGDCACFLSLLTLNMVTFNIKLPEQIIVLDTKFLSEEPIASHFDSDSDSDTEGVGVGESLAMTKSTEESHTDVDNLTKTQVETQKTVIGTEGTIDTEGVGVGESVGTTKSTEESHTDIDNLTKSQVEMQKTVIDTTQRQRTVQEPIAQADKVLPEASIDSVATLPVLVSDDHSYSVMPRTLIVEAGKLPSQILPNVTGDGNLTGESQEGQMEHDGDTGNDKVTSCNNLGQESNSVSKSSPVHAGYDILTKNISHARWLILQGHHSHGVCDTLTTNAQDNTYVNICEVTVSKAGTTGPGAAKWKTCATALTGTESTQVRTNVEQTLLWDFLTHDDGKFKGFTPREDRSTDIFNTKDYSLDSTDFDVDAMIKGLKLNWFKKDVQALQTVYDCIDQEEEMGIVASQLSKRYEVAIPKGSTKTLRDCLYLLVKQHLVLEVGFVILRFVTTKKASPWLIHSERLQNHPPDTVISSPITTVSSSKSQEINQPLSDVSIDQGDDCIIMGDDEEKKEEPSTPQKAKRRKRGNNTSSPKAQSDDGEEISSVVTERPRTPVVFLGKPWLTVEGYHSNSELLRYLRHVLLLINTKPGIKENSVFQFFHNLLHPMNCLEILKMLTEMECITRHIVYNLKATTIFKAPMQQNLTKPIYFYQPTADNLITFAKHHRRINATLQ